MSDASPTKISKTKLKAGTEAILALIIKPAMVGILLRNAGWSREEIADHQAEAIKAAAIQFGGLDVE